MKRLKSGAVSKRKWLLLFAILTLVLIELAVFRRCIVAEFGYDRTAMAQVSQVAADQLPPGVIRHVGFMGAVHIPKRDVTVQFEGDTCVRITSTYSSAHCCIGHRS